MKYTYKHTLHACYLGYATHAITNNIAPLLFIVFQNKYDISYAMLGRLILFNFGTQIVVDYLTIRYVDRIGYRKAAIFAHLMSTLGLISLSFLPDLLPSPYIGIMISIFLYAVGGGLIEVLITPIVDSLPGDAKAATISLSYAFYCWGQMAVVLFTTVGLWLIGENSWTLLPLLWAIVPLISMVRFTKVPMMPPIPEDEKIPLKKLISSKIFLLAVVLMICAGSAELSMSQWSSLFAEKGLKVNKVLGDLLGPCLFSIFMGLGRTVYGIKGKALNIRKVLLISTVFCIGCYLVTALAPNPFMALAGCALTGLSISLMWPGLFALIAETHRGAGTAMFGILALAGDIGCSVGPWITGIVSDASQQVSAVGSIAARWNMDLSQIGLKVGLLASVVFPLILFAGLLIMKEEKN